MKEGRKSSVAAGQGWHLAPVPGGLQVNIPVAKTGPFGR
ncbi:Hypothetical protein BSSP1_I1159 [Brucella suis bv. 2]|nr:No hit [Brucella canis HSK A52141]AIB17289.1 Hypothetical protein BSSP3_I0558 [Brucella suis bv. 2]AIB21257.1 Hypothetical protein BSPT1_I1169 [Brucella suis bv. 2]AIB24612.1 Hypothetical protein BSPT2_I1154 [Brucella suis bv. 2]AIB28010.1 Hypothetical protein BSSP1_I1159 [Brucella suis bv. 2]